MRKQIIQALRELEQQHECRFIFAAESGSRAWGFASPDSDYDVRALYVKPQEWYLSIEEPQKDTIEAMLPGELDISAWELRKALRLLHGCNLPLNEWLTSPVQYYDDGGFLAAIRACIPHCFNPAKAAHHYLALSAKSLETMDKSGSITIKKLFYVLRGLLAARWSSRFATMPPVKFTKLLVPELVPEDILAIITDLQGQKKEAKEKDTVVVQKSLLDFITKTREECLKEAQRMPRREPSSTEPLNDLFHQFAMPALVEQPTMIVLVGIPASGKSTFARRFDNTNFTVVSLDRLQTREKESKLFDKLLWYRQNCIIDNTNVTVDERRRFIAPAKALGYKVVGYYFQSVLADCLERNAQRTGKACIPDKGVIIKAKCLQLPKLAEGFDELHYVTINNGNFDISDWNPEAK